MTPAPEPYRSAPFRLGHYNVRGTPRMSAKAVTEDLEKILGKSGVISLVEFRWDYYWRILSRLVGAALSPAQRAAKAMPTWRSYPRFARGIAAPVFAGQMIAWKGDRWKRVKARTKVAHRGVAGISEDRRVRGVVLLDRATRLGLTTLVGHNVVGGDEDHDPQRRQDILDEDIAATRKMVRWALRQGWPVALTMDANIRRRSDAYARFVRDVVDDFGGEIHGEPGVEYVVVYPGRNGTRFVVTGDSTVNGLNTDHEGRLLVGYLETDKP